MSKPSRPKPSGPKLYRPRKFPARKSPDLLKADGFKGFSPADWLIGCVLFAAAVFVPLAVRYAERPVGPDQDWVFPGVSHIPDMFSYYKSVLILCAGAVILAYGVYRFYKLRPRVSPRFFLSPLYVAAGVFTLFTLLSFALSPYKYTVMHGISERFESVFALLGYFALLFAAIAFGKSLFKVKFLLWAVLISCFVIGLIGFFQFLGLDPFKTYFLQRLVMGRPPTPENPLTFNFTKVYATLYNPNCVGAYTALLMPLASLGAVFSGKDRPLRAAFAADAVLMFFCWIGCGSAGGFMGVAAAVLAVAAVFAALIIGKKLRIKLRPKALLGAGAFLLAGIMVCVLARPVRDALYQTAKKLLDITSTQSVNFLNGLYFSGGTATVSTVAGSVSITYDDSDGRLEVTGPNGERAAPVSFDTDRDTGVPAADYVIDGLGDVRILSRDNVISLQMGGIVFAFAIDEDNNIVPVSKSLRALDPRAAGRAIGFEGKELLGSGRGYIWSRTIPLMLDHLIIGSGPDTYILEFPQDDVTAKAKFMGNPYIVIDKAHNLFMQTAVNTGGISMLALIFIFGYYIVTAFASILRAKPGSGDESIGGGAWGLRFAVMAGIVGYAAASVSTDSTVSVSPVFWIVLGVGFALNRMEEG